MYGSPVCRMSTCWICARAIEKRSIEELPLYGVPFVIKDNIDLAGVPTTAGCPAYSYVPSKSSTAVQRLLDAGAIPLGKTNLDQFATGLVGTRSPYGACRNSFNPAFISGGSSSGSAVAVATGLASFALGTDTAGSGRVPAAFNNIIGLKPSRRQNQHSRHRTGVPVIGLRIHLCNDERGCGPRALGCRRV